jgi:hypothetical protein
VRERERESEKDRKQEKTEKWGLITKHYEDDKINVHVACMKKARN